MVGPRTSGDRAATEWMRHGVCRSDHVPRHDPAIWFPGRGASLRDARELCGSCPVRAECREYALTLPEHHGVWGGLSERERRRIRRERRRTERAAGQ